MEATLTQRDRLEAAKVASRGPALELIPFHSDFIGTAPPVAQLVPFTVTIGKRGAPRLSFGVMAVSAAAAWDQHADLAEVGERVEALPLRAETLTVDAKRHQLEQAKLREAGPFGCRCHLCGTPRPNMRSTWCSWCDGGEARS